jgi:hypothetical protein
VVKIKGWLKRGSTNQDALVLGLGLGVFISLTMTGLTVGDVLNALPPLVWAIIATLCTVFLVGVLVGRRMAQRSALEQTNRKIERVSAEGQAELEREVAAVRAEERRLREEREQTAERYAEHLSDALDTLERILSGTIPSVQLRDFIREGLLEPARALLLSPGHRGDVRLSVLERDGDEFKMAVSHGHDMGSSRRFRLKIAGSFAGLAYASGEVKWSNDLEDDNRFEPHPRARPGREYRSMVAVPLKHEGEVFAVLVVVGVEKEAFSAPDRIYVRSLGSVCDVAWAVVQKRRRETEEGDEGQRREAS